MGYDVGGSGKMSTAVKGCGRVNGRSIHAMSC